MWIRRICIEIRQVARLSAQRPTRGRSALGKPTTGLRVVHRSVGDPSQRTGAVHGRRMPAVPPLPPLPFLVRDALAIGVGEMRMRSRELHAPVPGVRMDPALRDDLVAVCRAVALLLPDGAAFSHLTAARLWGLPVSRRVERDRKLHVTGVGAGRPVRTERVVPHEGLPERERRTRHGVAVTSPVRTWFDLGGLLGPGHLDERGAERRGVDPLHEELVVLTDALLADDGLRQVPRYGVGPADLGRALAASAGARGVRRLRRAFGDASQFVDSPPETRLRLGLTRAGFPLPVVGADLVTSVGAWVARPDLCWPQVRVAVDYDGAPHLSRRKLRSDVERRDSLERVGWRHVVVFKEDLEEKWGMTLRRVAEAFEAHGCQDPSRAPAAARAVVRPRVVCPDRVT
ncbi:hypothetical protein ACFT5B_03010 [Luteimicrobium sp. NPDC057192]|uniref:hypothetical protein n=1 Tax=Luteimicrobium sp. NPDC057192 TaxID=3346042 RepID=UPI0036370915